MKISMWRVPRNGRWYVDFLFETHKEWKIFDSFEDARAYAAEAVDSMSLRKVDTLVPSPCGLGEFNNAVEKNRLDDVIPFAVQGHDLRRWSLSSTWDIVMFENCSNGSIFSVESAA